MSNIFCQEDENNDYNSLDFDYDIFNNTLDSFNSIENTNEFFNTKRSYNNTVNLIPQIIEMPYNVPCFLKGTKILTMNGEKNIETLKKGDSLICHDGRIIQLKNIYLFSCKNKNEYTLPYKIPKNTKINDTICNNDLYLSPLHEILVKENLLTAVKNLNFEQIRYDEIETIIYYHLVLPNYYTDAIFANGIVCEGYIGSLLKINTKYHKIFLKNIYKNNYRKIITNNEFNQLFKNSIIPKLLEEKLKFNSKLKCKKINMIL